MKSSLSELAGNLLSQFEVNISTSSLWERFNEGAVELMKILLGYAFSYQLSCPESSRLTSIFNRILIRDGTSWQLPAQLAGRFPGTGGGASNAGVKLYYLYDWLNGRTEELTVNAMNVPDSRFSLPLLKPGDLLLQDLGYWLLSAFREISEQKAYFISRLKYAVKIYSSDSHGRLKELDIQRLLPKMKVGEYRTLEVIVGKKAKLSSRLVIQKLPKKVADKRRRKLKEDKQNKRKGLSQGRLDFCDVLAFITNVPEEMLEDEAIIQLYTVRWQIEITFKCWKSGLDLENLADMKGDKFLCLLYANLILIVLTTHIFQRFRSFCLDNYAIELSELKSMKLLIGSSKELGRILRKYNGKKLFKELSNEILSWLNEMKNFCLKQTKKGRSSPHKITLRWLLKDI